MARRSKGRNRVTAQRDRIRIANLRLPAPLDLSRDLIAVEDHRRHHPSPVIRPALTVGGRKVRPLVRDPGRMLSSALSYPLRERVITCVRRKERREVLFALRRTGSGAGKRRRRNERSDIRC